MRDTVVALLKLIRSAGVTDQMTWMKQVANIQQEPKRFPNPFKTAKRFVDSVPSWPQRGRVCVSVQNRPEACQQLPPSAWQITPTLSPNFPAFTRSWSRGSLGPHPSAAHFLSMSLSVCRSEWKDFARRRAYGARVQDAERSREESRPGIGEDSHELLGEALRPCAVLLMSRISGEVALVLVDAIAVRQYQATWCALATRIVQVVVARDDEGERRRLLPPAKNSILLVHDIALTR